MFYPSLLGILVLIADIYAIVSIVQSSAESGTRILWVLIVFLFPVLGVILWFLLGPKGRRI